MTISNQCIERLRGVLIVSCQASDGEPLCAPEHIKALALSAVNGGALGLRLEGADNVRHLREAVSLPIVALTKTRGMSDAERLNAVYITPTIEDAASLASAGADIIAIDATNRPRPGGETVPGLVKKIHDQLGKPVWADVSNLEEGLAAAEAGADVISTTLSGYTRETAGRPNQGPDIELLAALSKGVPLPVVLEGKVWMPSEVTNAFLAGAYAVVVGSAITRPQLITRRFIDAIPRKG